MKAERVMVGRIAKPLGIRGEVVVHPTGDDPERFAPGTSLFLSEDTPEAVTIETLREDGGSGRGRGIVVTLRGRTDRTSVEDLAGRTLFQDVSNLPPLPEGVYYHFQLIGLRVTLADGSELGTLDQILSVGGTDLYEVRGRNREWLVPSRKEFVEWIDLGKGEIRLTDRADLLEAQEKETEQDEPQG